MIREWIARPHGELIQILFWGADALVVSLMVLNTNYKNTEKWQQQKVIK